MDGRHVEGFGVEGVRFGARLHEIALKQASGVSLVMRALSATSLLIKQPASAGFPIPTLFLKLTWCGYRSTSLIRKRPPLVWPTRTHQPVSSLPVFS